MHTIDPPLPPMLAEAAAVRLEAIRPWAQQVDADGDIGSRSLAFRAAVGSLATQSYAALGGTERTGSVGEAAALLALFHRLDEQAVVAFLASRDPHEPVTERQIRKVLAGSMASILSGRPMVAGNRGALAAELGRRFDDLCIDPERLGALHAAIEQTNRVQAQAVALMSQSPERSMRVPLRRITGELGAYRVIALTLVGTLPADAQRSLTDAELRGFRDRGFASQCAHALADLEGDLAAGLVSSLPGWLVWREDPVRYLDALATGDMAWIYRSVHAHKIDRVLLNLRSMRATEPLAALGAVPHLVDWLSRWLGQCYLTHPLCVAGVQRPRDLALG